MNRDELKDARESLVRVRETREVPFGSFEMREIPDGHGGSSLRFSGYASVTCADRYDTSHSYTMQDLFGDYEESMIRGCFGQTIRQNCDTNFVVNHTGVSMARTKPGTLKLAEDSTGLHTEATLNPTRTDVQILRAAVEDGDIDEMSFSFLVVRQSWAEPEWDRRYIMEVSLHHGDVSPCNFGANGHTAGLLALRSKQLGRSAERQRILTHSPLPVVLPDHTTQARLDLARANLASANLDLLKYRAGRHSQARGNRYDPIVDARRALAAARARAR